MIMIKGGQNPVAKFLSMAVEIWEIITASNTVIQNFWGNIFTAEILKACRKLYLSIFGMVALCCDYEGPYVPLTPRTVLFCKHFLWNTSRLWTKKTDIPIIQST